MGRYYDLLLFDDKWSPAPSIAATIAVADDELLDYCDDDGAPLGVATRRAVHDRGLWHRTLHLWLASPEEDGALLYQLRSATTANWPGLLDVSVAGHLLAGETYLDGLRESREEIGIAVPAAAVIALGVRREQHRDPGGGWNRELQGVHVARLDPAWGAFAAVDHEAAGLFRIANRDGLSLHRGEVGEIECDALVVAGDAVRAERRRVTRASFVPRADDYYARMHDIAARLIRDEPLPLLAEADNGA
jgi:isopentenyldiphosphate isomerase